MFRLHSFYCLKALSLPCLKLEVFQTLGVSLYGTCSTVENKKNSLKSINSPKCAGRPHILHGCKNSDVIVMIPVLIP